MTISDDHAYIAGQPVHLNALDTGDFSVSVSVENSDGAPVFVNFPLSGRGAFGRQRVASPFTLFDSKQLFDNQPEFWSDLGVTGSSTTSTHNPFRASTLLSVGTTTFGTRVRQTKQRFNYQPGKSQLIFETFVLGAGASGITRRVGQFDTKNGLFLELSGTTLSVVRRTNVTGIPTDVPVTQANWNIDKLDGTGASGITLDTSLSQILVLDYEWLGVGSIRFGFVIDGNIYYCHQINNANVLGSVYMSSPNLPLRYEISNDGTGAASSLEHICSTVISEGGVEPGGKLVHISTSGAHVNANTIDALYAVIGVRLQESRVGTTIVWESISMLAETNDKFEWVLLLNPVVASTFAYSNVTGSSVQRALGATANTVSGGEQLAGGWGADNSGIEISPQNAVKLGQALDGTLDTMVLCVRPLSANLDIQGSVTLRQL